MARTRSKAKATRLKLRLYIAGHAANSLQALATLRTMGAEHWPSAHDLEVVDMLEQPARALADGILVTPTLLKLHPLPVQRIVGNLSDLPRLLRVLEGK